MTEPLERSAWLPGLRRRSAEQEAALADDYDEHWGLIDEEHRAFVERFLAELPEGGRVLDAACGVGKYFGMVLESDRSVLGVDQTGAYLAKALEKHPGAVTERRHLHELPYVDEFDGVLCVDAMEFIPPEDWPLVLERFATALRPGGWVYLTVELVAEDELQRGHEAALRLGLPVLEAGEAIWEEPDWYYHFYPSMDRVRFWLAGAGFAVVDELEGQWLDGEYAYHHVLARRGSV